MRGDVSFRWRVPIAYLIGLVIAVILGVAAFFKAADPGLFAEQISSYRITPESWSGYLAYIFVVIELALAVALLTFVWPRFLFVGTILLMLGFIFATVWSWAHGHAEGCACFGRLVERGPSFVIIEDGMIAVAAAVALPLTRGFRTRAWRWFPFALLLVPVAGLTALGTSLPLDELIVGVRPGTEVGDLALEDARHPVDEGLVLVAIVDDDCSLCEEGLAFLNKIASSGSPARVVGAYAGTGAEAQAWRMKHLPSFLVAHAPEKVLRQYYRRPPVTLLLRDGVVQQVWWDRVPAPAEVRVSLAANPD